MANQLQGLDSVNKKIILHVNSAYGFGLVKGSIVIYATLMNQTLETAIIPVNKNELKFSSDIIWYMDNATLRKLKMSNASIKVECFRIPIDKLSSNEKLGYLLLKVKGAQTINPTSNDRIENVSYKLIGSKNCCYDLNLSLRIEDLNDKAIGKSPKKINYSKLINNKNKNDETCLKKKDNKHFEENIEVDSPIPDVNNVMLEQIDISPEKHEHQNELNFDFQQSIGELEDWKDKQMLLFNEKMKLKEEQLLKEFNNKWLNDRKLIEEELTFAMSKCKALAKELDEMSDKLKERDAIVTAKELELACQKNSMDNKYIGLMSSNAQTHNELSKNIFELEKKLHGLEKLNILLRKENEKLKYDNSCGLHVQELENKISILEGKLEDANKSCMFFKERWITSVRKINQLYTKFHGTKTDDHLLNNKQNIQNILTNQLVERQHDEEKLRLLLNDISKLRHDMTNTNFLDL
ncbi:PREDICTED: putative leucine-rich repeat-containing protein DDB_G0290503 isoform X2 [Diuraphis noxia]|uniref:putative leucine-rich repeat-containing protein DDB_G0290503 isoform X2 n=1 Tax=Diuraphis noxia TaxID=143948 RepID=UPI000763948D|nr:PREDICTED: putative leucine-rich repeat-containing protein DDB_G0290503 isoform X2 [Diuraphis noxia]